MPKPESHGSERLDPGAERVAPGRLRLVQELLNAAPEDPTPAQLLVSEQIRAAYAAGEDPATLAARFGLGRQLVSAIVREKRFAGAVDPDDAAEIASIGTLVTASRWLESRRLLGAGTRLDDTAHGRLLALRSLLLQLALANSGQPLPPSVSQELDALAGAVELRVSFSGGPNLAPAGSPRDAPLAWIVAAVYDAMRDGTWQRLKACPAEGCGHTFYDTSKNRTATWCSMSICGNRAKVRNYQSRRRTPRP